MAISQEEWDALPQEEKNRRIHEFKRTLRHILEGHEKEVVAAALKSILEDMKAEQGISETQRLTPLELHREATARRAKEDQLKKRRRKPGV